MEQHEDREHYPRSYRNPSAGSKGLAHLPDGAAAARARGQRSRLYGMQMLWPGSFANCRRDGAIKMPPSDPGESVDSLFWMAAWGTQPSGRAANLPATWLDAFFAGGPGRDQVAEPGNIPKCLYRLCPCHTLTPRRMSVTDLRARQRLLFARQIIEGARAFDLGCGNGATCTMLSSLGFVSRSALINPKGGSLLHGHKG
jgi:hypothetical protein